jgi:hypothetical protein
VPTRRAHLSAPLTALLGFLLLGSQPAPHLLDQAIEAQRALVAENPSDAGAQNDLANLLELSGDRLGAEQAYQRSIELDPDDPAPRFNYALLLIVTDRHGQALEQLERVVEIDPGNAWAHYQIGTIWDLRGSERKARRAYARAFELDPQLTDPRVNPDILDNREATAAMLLAWQRGTPAATTPRLYSDGGRIASLLIRVPEPPEPSELPDAELDDENGEGGFARITSPPIEPAGSAAAQARASSDDTPGESDFEPGEPRVLDATDLAPRRSVNQISSPAGATRGVPSTSSGRRPTIRRPGGGSTTFGSTGRLEPVLRPVDPSAFAVAG